MASLRYLWSHRASFSVFSKSFFRAWAKRILTLNELYKRNHRRKNLNRKGASINETAEIGFLTADGNKKNLSIGSFSFIGRASLALHDKIEIGSFVCVNDGVQLLTASHDINDPLWNHIKGTIVIKDYAWIATNAIILPNVTIGYGAVVGAGAVVSKSVPDFAIVVGNPAKIIDTTRVKDLRYNPCEFLASNRAWLVG